MSSNNISLNDSPIVREGDQQSNNWVDNDNSVRSIVSDVTFGYSQSSLMTSTANEVDVDDLAAIEEGEEAPSARATTAASGSRSVTWDCDVPQDEAGLSKNKNKTDEASVGTTACSSQSSSSTQDLKVPQKASSTSSITSSRWMLFRGAFRGMNPFPNARAEKGATRRAKAQKQQRRSFRTNSLAALAEEEDEEDQVTAASTHDTRRSTKSSLSSLSSFYARQDCGDFITSRFCRMALLLLLCLLVVLVVVMVVLMTTGGTGGLLGIKGIFGQEDDLSNSDETRLRAQGKINDALPSSSVVASLDESSPQSKASRWLQDHPLLLQDEEEVPSWRVRQLFAMATFYYAFNGQDWPERQRHSWLSYDIHECLWGDDGVAVIDPHTLSYMYWGRTSCHDSFTRKSMETKRGRLRDLNLDWRVATRSSSARAGEYQPKPITGPVRMPEEIEFLTELQTLGIENCGVTGDLADLIPSQISNLSNLKRLSFQNNNLHGRMPTTSLWPLSLQKLNVGQNTLTGPIPSQLGLLSAQLQELMLFNNQFSGTLPSELGSLQQLTGLAVRGNDLTGTIPIELTQLSRLEWLHLYTNEIQGSVPSGICQLPSLQSVAVDCSVDCGTACGEGVCECPP